MDGVLVTGLGFAITGVERASDLFVAAPPGPAEPFDPVARLAARGLRYKDRATRLALCAARDALVDAGLLPVPGLAAPGLAVPGETVGVVVSSNLGNIETVCAVTDVMARETASGTSPMDLPNASSNEVASSVAIWFGLRGANLTLCNGDTSGLDAVWWAAALVTAGRVDRVLVVGVETDNGPVRTLLGLADRERMFDGAVAMVVEGSGPARDRGAVPVAAVGRYGRRAALDESLVRSVLHGSTRQVGLWLTSGPEPARLRRTVPAAARRQDLTERFGRCSGALGVLQCAAASGWLGTVGARQPDVALAAIGGQDGAAAAMALSPVGGDR